MKPVYWTLVLVFLVIAGCGTATTPTSAPLESAPPTVSNLLVLTPTGISQGDADVSPVSPAATTAITSNSGESPTSTPNPNASPSTDPAKTPEGTASPTPTAAGSLPPTMAPVAPPAKEETPAVTPGALFTPTIATTPIPTASPKLIRGPTSAPTITRDIIPAKSPSSTPRLPTATPPEPTAFPTPQVKVGTNVGQRAPDFTVTTIDGKEVNSSSFLGQRPFILYFFASW